MVRELFLVMNEIVYGGIVEIGIIIKFSVHFLIHEYLISKCREKRMYFLVWKETQQDLVHPGGRDEQCCVHSPVLFCPPADLSRSHVLNYTLQHILQQQPGCHWLGLGLGFMLGFRVRFQVRI